MVINGKTKFDPVIRPAHYNQGKIEVWDFIVDQDLNYCRGNAIKYICRAGAKYKDKEIEDLNKAIAYLEREKRRILEGKADEAALV